MLESFFAMFVRAFRLVAVICNFAPLLCDVVVLLGSVDEHVLCSMDLH